jgi:hypothetical protein
MTVMGQVQELKKPLALQPVVVFIRQFNGLSWCDAAKTL